MLQHEMWGEAVELVTRWPSVRGRTFLLGVANVLHVWRHVKRASQTDRAPFPRGGADGVSTAAACGLTPVATAAFGGSGGAAIVLTVAPADSNGTTAETRICSRPSG